MKIIVTGGRKFADAAMVVNVLLQIEEKFGSITELVEGGARGADRLCREFGENCGGVEVITVDADWKTHRFAAGPIRNSQMLNAHLDAFALVSFPGDSGTKDMTDKATKAGMRVIYAQKVFDYMKAHDLISIAA